MEHSAPLNPPTNPLIMNPQFEQTLAYTFNLDDLRAAWDERSDRFIFDKLVKVHDGEYFAVHLPNDLHDSVQCGYETTKIRFDRVIVSIGLPVFEDDEEDTCDTESEMINEAITDWVSEAIGLEVSRTTTWGDFTYGAVAAEFKLNKTISVDGNLHVRAF
jgi:hypothetical protein